MKQTFVITYLLAMLACTNSNNSYLSEGGASRDIYILKLSQQLSYGVDGQENSLTIKEDGEEIVLEFSKNDTSDFSGGQESPVLSTVKIKSSELPENLRSILSGNIPVSISKPSVEWEFEANENYEGLETIYTLELYKNKVKSIKQSSLDDLDNRSKVLFKQMFELEKKHNGNKWAN